MRTVYHVTSATNAEKIKNEGFEGGWGDAGFGVYFYGELHNALAYLDRGGWDGELDRDDAVIVAAEVDNADLDFVIPDPEWPNPEDYDDVLWYPMEETSDARWKPKVTVIAMSDEVEHEAPAPGP